MRQLVVAGEVLAGGAFASVVFDVGCRWVMGVGDNRCGATEVGRSKWGPVDALSAQMQTAVQLLAGAGFLLTDNMPAP